MFKPGNPGGPGRPKGSGSKIVREIFEKETGRSLIEELLQIAKDQPRLKPDIYMELLPYCYPKFHSVDVSAEVEAKVESDSVTALTQWLTNIIEIDSGRQ